MKTFAGDKLWLILGPLRERMSPEQRAMQLLHMPPRVVQWWQHEGEPVFLDFQAQLGL